jgi:hypothetical protein
MANNKNTVNINQVFDDLDIYRNFCRDFGYRFNEADLYNTRSGNYKQFQRFVSGKPIKNQWEADLAKFKEQELSKVRG